MSGTVVDDGPETLAAEYVLGTLDSVEAETARARREVDRLFASEVRFWEERLFPLTTLVPPVAPPATLWQRIEETIGGSLSRPQPRAANENRAGWWRPTAIGALAIAASLAAFILARPPVPQAIVPQVGAPQVAPLQVRTPEFAVLSPTGAAAPVLVALTGPDGAIVVRPSAAITVAAGRDLQLWSLAAGATRPISLGVLPPAGKQVPPIAPGTKLLVSLEPKGGSPTGQPTGPVVYGGTLQGL